MEYDDMYANEYYRGCPELNERQAEIQAGGLLLALRWAVKALVFAPLLATGYLISDKILPAAINPLYCFGLALLLAGVLFYGLVSLKDGISRLRRSGKLLWLPLFIAFVAFTGGVPALCCYKLIEYLAHNTGTVNLVISAAFGLYAFSRYTAQTGHIQGKKTL